MQNDSPGEGKVAWMAASLRDKTSTVIEFERENIRG